MVEADTEAGEIMLVFLADTFNPLLFRDPMSLSTDHDRGAVRIVGAHKEALVTAKPLKTYPDICLDIFDKMAQVNWSIGVGQCSCDQNPAFCHVDESSWNHPLLANLSRSSPMIVLGVGKHATTMTE